MIAHDHSFSYVLFQLLALMMIKMTIYDDDDGACYSVDDEVDCKKRKTDLKG